MSAENPRAAIRLDRRRFLQVMAGTAGALMVGIRLAHAADAPLPPALLGEDFHDLGAYVRIDGDGNVLITLAGVPVYVIWRRLFSHAQPQAGSSNATMNGLIPAEMMDGASASPGPADEPCQQHRA